MILLISQNGEFTSLIRFNIYLRLKLLELKLAWSKSKGLLARVGTISDLICLEFASEPRISDAGLS